MKRGQIKLRDQFSPDEHLLSVISAMEAEVESHSHYGASSVVPSREVIEREYSGWGHDQ